MGIAIAIGLIVVAVVLIFLANYQLWELQAEINRVLPEGHKFEPMFWTIFQTLELRDLQRRLLPDNSRWKYCVRLGISGLFLLLVAAGIIFTPRFY